MRKTVYCLDDERPLLRILTRLLGDEYDVVVGTSGTELLAECAAGRTFDVILCDLHMPDMPGTEVLQKLRAVDPRQAQRLVFVSGDAIDASHVAPDLEGPVLEKPYDAAALRRAIATIARTG